MYECNSVSTDQVEVDIRWDLMSQESESEETVTEWWKHLFSSYLVTTSSSWMRFSATEQLACRCGENLIGAKTLTCVGNNNFSTYQLNQ